MIRLSTLRSSHKHLLYVLMDYAGNDGDAHPKLRTLGFDLDLSIERVRRMIRELRQAGIVVAETCGRRNSYQIQWDKVPGPADRSDAATPGSRSRKPTDTPGAGARNGKATPGAGAQTPGAGARNGESIPGADAQPLLMNTKKERTQRKNTKAADAAKAPTITSTVEFELMEAWNAIDGLPRILKFNAKRRTALRERLKDDDWDWRQAVELIPQSRFLMGQNDRGWTANIDWFLKPDNVTKILEGNYSPRNGHGSNGAGQNGKWSQFAQKDYER